MAASRATPLATTGPRSRRRRCCETSRCPAFPARGSWCAGPRRPRWARPKRGTSPPSPAASRPWRRWGRSCPYSRPSWTGRATGACGGTARGWWATPGTARGLTTPRPCPLRCSCRRAGQARRRALTRCSRPKPSWCPVELGWQPSPSMTASSC